MSYIVKWDNAQEVFNTAKPVFYDREQINFLCPKYVLKIKLLWIYYNQSLGKENITGLGVLVYNDN